MRASNSPRVSAVCQGETGRGCRDCGGAESEWALLCVTRLGKVSILRSLDLYTAREAYKRLRPEERPRVYDRCGKCGNSTHTTFGRSYGPTDDFLNSVEVIGPGGAGQKELDPWNGVEVARISPQCWCDRKMGKESATAADSPLWDKQRSDFWNDPNLWDGIDPVTQRCWTRSRNEPFYSHGSGGGGAECSMRWPTDLGGNDRQKSREDERGERRAAANIWAPQPQIIRHEAANQAVSRK